MQRCEVIDMAQEITRSVKSFQEKRRLRRVRVGLPVRVSGINSKGVQFEELSQSVDLNADGALILLRQQLQKGTWLKLSLDLPQSMGKTAPSKPVYQTEAVVLRIETNGTLGNHRVAVRFQSASTKANPQEVSQEHKPVPCNSKGRFSMQTRKISLGEMWRSEASGKVYIVTSFCKEVLSSYACLRCIEPSEGSRKAKLVKTDSGETLMGFSMAEIV